MKFSELESIIILFKLANLILILLQQNFYFVTSQNVSMYFIRIIIEFEFRRPFPPLSVTKIVSNYSICVKNLNPI